MRHRFFTSPASAVIMAALLLLVSAAGQTPAPEASAASEEAWTHPRTKWGHPDLQGLWTNETITPFERPENMADKKFLTAEEAAKIENRTAQRRAAADGTSPPGSVGAYNQIWMDSGTKVLRGRQTSLVVDPSNGRVPTKPSAEATRDYNKAHAMDSYVHMSVWDRCITRGVPGSMFPAGYNNAYQILQTPEYVAILYEMIHDVRIIPLDGRPHVDEKIGCGWAIHAAAGKATRLSWKRPTTRTRAGSHPTARPVALRASRRARRCMWSSVLRA